MTVTGEDPGERTVQGRVTFGSDGRPAAGRRVHVMDAEHRSIEPLGQGETGSDGTFQVPYDAEGYRVRYGRAPDIYLLVYGGERLLASTRPALVRDAGPDQHVCVQLADEGVALPPGAAASIVGYQVDRGALDRLDQSAFLEAARGVLSGANGDGLAAHERAASLFAQLSFAPVSELRAPRSSLTPHIRALVEIARARGWHDALLELEAELEREQDVTWELHSCPPFLIRYTRTGVATGALRGKGAVSSTDKASEIVLPGSGKVMGATCENGVPDYVERTCFWLQRALAVFTSPPACLRPPMEGKTIEVEIFNASTTVSPAGAIRMRPNCSNDELAWSVVHELAHLVQRRYETHGLGAWHGLGEGCTALAEEFVVDPVNRYIAEAGHFFSGDGTLARPSQSIIGLGYRQALFLKYFVEQHSRLMQATAPASADLQSFRVLLECFDRLGYTTAALEEAVRTLPWYQSLFRFEYLDAARQDPVASETLLGNFWVACFLKDIADVGDPRFTFLENAQASILHDFLGGDRVDRLQQVVREATVRLAPGGTVTLASGPGALVPTFGARFYQVDLDPNVHTLRVTFRAGAGFSRPLMQIVEIQEAKGEGVGRPVRDILRSDRTAWSRTIASERGGALLDHILIIVAGTEDAAGPFSLTVQAVERAPDVMVTQWNRRPGTHYEIDPFEHAWTWTSPDVWVDSNKERVADAGVVPGQDNRLFIRLRNQGSTDASGIQVDFWYQAAAGILSDTAWQRMRNLGHEEQVLTGQTLAMQEEGVFAVDWAPPAAPDVQHFSVRVVVTVPGDPNTDNKRCIASFASLVVRDEVAEVTLVRRAFSEQEDVRVVSFPER
jgi:hypothetical protein